MYDIQEHAVFAQAAGAAMNRERLARVATFAGTGTGNYTDCHEYRISCPERLSEDLLRSFRITPALLRKWRSKGELFQISLFIRKGKLIGGRIHKHRPIPGDPPGISYLTAPTRQEIRITERLLRYLSEKDAVL